MEECNLRKLLWGTILEAEHSFRYKCRGRKLRLTQATLSPSADVNNRVMVKCCRQEGPMLYICSLRTGSVESVFLDLIINEDVEFSITGGSTSVHLLGYFICSDDELEEVDDISHDECSYSADEDSYDSDFVVSDDVVEYEDNNSQDKDIGKLQNKDQENSPVKPRKRLRRIAQKEVEIFKNKGHDENGTQEVVGGLSLKKKKEKAERQNQKKMEEMSSQKKKRRTVERSSTGNTDEDFDNEIKKEKEKKKQKKSAKRRDATA